MILAKASIHRPKRETWEKENTNQGYGKSKFKGYTIAMHLYTAYSKGYGLVSAIAGTSLYQGMSGKTQGYRPRRSIPRKGDKGVCSSKDEHTQEKHFSKDKCYTTL